jgi:hypothetical protein
MKRVINAKKKYNKLGTLLIAGMMMGTTACSSISLETTPVETSIEKISVIEPEEGKEYVTFDELNDSKAYIVYSKNDEHTFYDVEFLKERVTDDYTAYYGTRDGKLVSLDINDKQPGDKFSYKGYLMNDVIELNDVKDELYNPNLSKIIVDGIDYDNETITYDSLVLMELSYISRYKDEVSDKVYGIEETGLSK